MHTFFDPDALILLLTITSSAACLVIALYDGIA